MILMFHLDKVVNKVSDLETNTTVVIPDSNPVSALFELAKAYPDRSLVWCHESQKDNIDLDGITSAFHLKNSMLSYAANNYMLPQVGYVEDSPFLKVNGSVSYPTWMMSSMVGVIHASILIRFKNLIDTNVSLDYALNSIAKLGMSKGLFCYSEPKLLKNPEACDLKQLASKKDLFKFVKQHYKSRWILLLLFNYLWHEKQLPFLSLIRSLFYKQLECNDSFKLESLITSNHKENFSIDVIIPTIGRKQYLYNVLKDLASQTLLPQKVVIVEQNPDSNSVTELDYITNEDWPFKIIHHFIHQTGACNARNLALQDVNSDLVYLADDDIRLGPDILFKITKIFENFALNVITLSCKKAEEEERITQEIQWTVFGSGTSVIKSKYLKDLRFDTALEFGYGEDVDFGMQLRNQGADVVYVPELEILHLSAPIGGFRSKFTHPWSQDDIQPKPSPTVLLNRRKNTTKQQLLGYKTMLFFKFFKEQSIKNPFNYYRIFKKQWQQSIYWSNFLEAK